MVALICQGPVGCSCALWRDADGVRPVRIEDDVATRVTKEKNKTGMQEIISDFLSIGFTRKHARRTFPGCTSAGRRSRRILRRSSILRSRLRVCSIDSSKCLMAISLHSSEGLTASIRVYNICHLGRDSRRHMAGSSRCCRMLFLVPR